MRSTATAPRLIVPSLILLVVVHAAAAAAAATTIAINITVDDDLPDPNTGNAIEYSLGQWANGQNCPGCAAQPDKANTFGYSWHDTTFDPPARPSANATFIFAGTAIYVYGILCHFIRPDLVASSDVYFSIDGQLSGRFQYRPDGVGSYTYNELLFSIDSLPHESHILQIRNGQTAKANSLLLLDYVVYTTRQEILPNRTKVASTSAVLSRPSVLHLQPSGKPPALSSANMPRALTLSVALNILLGTLTMTMGLWIYVLRRRKSSASASMVSRTSSVSSSWPVASTIAAVPPSVSRTLGITERRLLSSTDVTLLSNVCVVRSDTAGDSSSSTSGASAMARKTEKWRTFIYGGARSSL